MLYAPHCFNTDEYYFCKPSLLPELRGGWAAQSPPGSWQWPVTEQEVADLVGHRELSHQELNFFTIKYKPEGWAVQWLAVGFHPVSCHWQSMLRSANVLGTHPKFTDVQRQPLETEGQCLEYQILPALTSSVLNECYKYYWEPKSSVGCLPISMRFLKFYLFFIFYEQRDLQAKWLTKHSCPW